jgi:hypothetical protein
VAVFKRFFPPHFCIHFFTSYPCKRLRPFTSNILLSYEEILFSTYDMKISLMIRALIINFITNAPSIISDKITYKTSFFLKTWLTYIVKGTGDLNAHIKGLQAAL